MCLNKYIISRHLQLTWDIWKKCYNPVAKYIKLDIKFCFNSQSAILFQTETLHTIFQNIGISIKYFLTTVQRYPLISHQNDSILVAFKSFNMLALDFYISVLLALSIISSCLKCNCRGIERNYYHNITMSYCCMLSNWPIDSPPKMASWRTSFVGPSIVFTCQSCLCKPLSPSPSPIIGQ